MEKVKRIHLVYPEDIFDQLNEMKMKKGMTWEEFFWDLTGLEA